MFKKLSKKKLHEVMRGCIFRLNGQRYYHCGPLTIDIPRIGFYKHDSKNVQHVETGKYSFIPTEMDVLMEMEV